MNEVYSEYDKVYGPYTRSDGRKHVVLVSHNEDGSIKKKITVSYPKYLMEKKLNRYLVDDETVDHINEDKTFDEHHNLQILPRAENARKSAIGNKYLLGYKQTEEHKRSGEKNGMAKLTSDEVLNLRRKFTANELTKKEIRQITGMSEKGVYNILHGNSYSDVPEKCISKRGRPKNK